MNSHKMREFYSPFYASDLQYLFMKKKKNLLKLTGMLSHRWQK